MTIRPKRRVSLLGSGEPMNFVNLVAGFTVGAAVGMTGVGGGALMTPILVLLFGFAPSTAVGTDLWFAAITKVFGGALHNHNGSVDWQVIRRLSLGSVPAAVATLVWMDWTNHGQTHNSTIIHALGGVLLLTAVGMLARKKIQALAVGLRTKRAAMFIRAQPILTVMAGVVLGIIVPLTSVGAGALGTVMLLYLYPLRMNPRRLAGTDIVHAIPLAIISGIGHLLMGNVDGRLLLNLLAGSIPGILLATLLARKSPDIVLRSIIAVLLVAVSLKLLSS
jgi:uncharacterized membrane protein YfcA